MSVSVHVVVINANCLHPQNIFLVYVFYDANCEWVFFIIVFLFFFFVSFLDIYAGASKLTNSVDLHFIRYANSAENGKIDTDHKR